jgi:hypothetical protein
MIRPGATIYDNHVAIIIRLHGGAFDGDNHVWRGPPHCLPREVLLDDGRQAFRYRTRDEARLEISYQLGCELVRLDMHLVSTEAGRNPDAIIPVIVQAAASAPAPQVVAQPQGFWAKLKALLTPR